LSWFGRFRRVPKGTLDPRSKALAELTVAMFSAHMEDIIMRDTPTLRKLSSHEEHMLVMRKLENQKDRLDEKIMSARKLDAALANAYCAIGVAYATIEEGKKEDDDEVPAE
jgi:hypothetical protein